MFQDFDCFVCAGINKVSISYNCGHAVCISCHEKMNFCPECRGETENESSVPGALIYFEQPVPKIKKKKKEKDVKNYLVLNSSETFCVEQVLDGSLIIANNKEFKHIEKEIVKRCESINKILHKIKKAGGLDKFSTSYTSYGIHFKNDGSVMCTEHAPSAYQLYLMGEFNNWNRESHQYQKSSDGVWTLNIPAKEDGSCPIKHLSKIKVIIKTHCEEEFAECLSPWAQYVNQTSDNAKNEGFAFEQIIWKPINSYKFAYPKVKRPEKLKIYECHVGIATEYEKIGSYKEFSQNIIPRIVELGYNAIQLMAIVEHANYASFGYEVTNFFAVSSRYGTPDEFKELIDIAHFYNVFVLIDVNYSQNSKNTTDKLISCFSEKSNEETDDSLFNYTELEVLRYLLSNLRFYAEEYLVDGFRFNNVGSIMDQKNISCQKYRCFIIIANYMLHHIYPDVITVAGDLSETNISCRPVLEGGNGFDFNLQSVIPDQWLGELFNLRYNFRMSEIGPLVQNRRLEKTITCTESHRRLLAGENPLAHSLLFFPNLGNMAIEDKNSAVDNNISFYKMIRLIARALGGGGFLNFMGTEFGHPDLLELPNQNSSSYYYARRQWNLVDDHSLKYKYMNNFDKKINHLGEKFRWDKSDGLEFSCMNEDDKTIALQRGEVIFIFNFHLSKCLINYKIGVDTEGIYEYLLNSDDAEFGGLNRQPESKHCFTFNEKFYGRRRSLLASVASRSCVILQKIN